MPMLLQAAEDGSFSEASRDLGLSLPAVSRKVLGLEAFLEASMLTGIVTLGLAGLCNEIEPGSRAG